jgi:hypothetical protein
MRTYPAVFSLLLLPYLAAAQDPGMQAAQAAQQAAQQANQQAMQNMQQASQAAQLASQQAMQNDPGPCCFAWTAPPKFSVKSGKYPGPTTVKITDATRGAVIYYTTDGWTPTINSTRYRGPIPVDSTTNLQAIAIAPYAARSLVVSAQYEINGSPAGSPANNAVSAVNNFPRATPVPLVFAADVSSKTASVGDKISLTLTEDLSVGNVVIKKGATATATVTAVDPNGAGGAPGVLSFEVDSLQSAAGPIALQGGATKEGQAKPPNAAVLIPVVGPFTLFKHGADAIISKGTPFIAYLEPNAATTQTQP